MKPEAPPLADEPPHPSIAPACPLLRFLGLNALAGISVGVAKVILSLYALALQADAWQLGLIAAAQSLDILLMSVPAGVLVDRYGPLPLFSIGTLCSGLLYLLLPWVGSAAVLCLVILLISCFMPLRIVALSAMFMQQIGRVGVGMAGWFRATHMLGMMLVGPLLAAWMLGHIGFAGAYVAIAGSFLILVIIAPPVLRHYQRSAEPARRLHLGEVKTLFALPTRDRQLGVACLREFLIQAANQYYTFFIVVIAAQRFGFEPASAAGLISVQGVSFILALMALGGVAARVPERLFLRAGCAIAAGALALLGAASQAWPLWLGGAALGLGLGMLQIVNITWLAKVGNVHGQGRIAGLTTFIGPAGGLVGSLMGGASGQWLGLQGVFYLLAMAFSLLWVTTLSPKA